MRVVIVGGVAGGASAAARLRRLDESASILLLERGPDVSFANCGMPYYIGGEISDREKLLVAKPELLRNRFRIDVQTLTEVRSIDPSDKVVGWVDLRTGKTGTSPYDKLILSPGASPILPEIDGVHLPGVHVLRNLDDADRILKAAQNQGKKALVVGGGFIGLEVAENLVHKGLQTTLIQRDSQVLGFLDPDLASVIHQELTQKGVKLHLGTELENLRQAPDGVGVIASLKTGEKITVDLVVIGIGVRPENALAKNAGLKLGVAGSIMVNSHMQTSDPDIYAVGDAVSVVHTVSGKTVHVPLAGPANRQGRIAAEHIVGRDSTFRGVQGTAVIRVFQKTAACSGLNTRQLTTLGVPFRSVTIHPADHARYFPGAQEMTLKLFFHSESGKILGGQGVGGNGVDKRLDIVAMAIQGGMTVFDLEESELCYAPQYGSAKDPINMLGFVAGGLLRGDHPQIDSRELSGLLSEHPPVLIDVRTPKEFAGGHLPGALAIPVDELRSRLSEIPKDKPLVVYCQVGMRGYIATRILLQNHYSVRNLSGGFSSWRMNQGPVQVPKS